MTCRAVFLHAAAAVLCLAPVPAAAQATCDLGSNYQQHYGAPVDVTIADLDQTPEAYLNRAVRTHGILELEGGQTGSYVLRDSFGAVKIVPLSEVRDHLQFQEHSLIGQETEVTGVVTRMPAAEQRSAGLARVQVCFWSFTAEPRRRQEEKPLEVSLESLVRAPGRRDGRLVRVVGQFRGGNLHGDLPNTSRRGGGDWVLKNDAFAVWITGKKPRGDGFDLDRSSKVDMDRWLEVVGRPFSRKGVTWIQATRVAMASPPAPPAPAPEAGSVRRPPTAPVIVFAAPLDGDDEVAVDSRFTVQFSKDMDESSFRDRVVLRYAGPARPGDRPITNTRFVYDAGPRTLIVDPGLVLAPGRDLELLLLPGIVDVEGLPLAPRPSAAPPAVEGVVEVLRYSTEG